MENRDSQVAVGTQGCAAGPGKFLWEEKVRGPSTVRTGKDTHRKEEWPLLKSRKGQEGWGDTFQAGEGSMERFQGVMFITATEKHPGMCQEGAFRHQGWGQPGELCLLTTPAERKA